MKHNNLQGTEGAQALNLRAETAGLVIYSICRRTHVDDLSLDESDKDAMAVPLMFAIFLT